MEKRAQGTSDVDTNHFYLRGRGPLSFVILEIQIE